MQLKSVHPAHPQAPFPVHVVLCYKNFAASAGVSHIGLGVAALNVAKILMRHGIKATVLPIVNVTALDAFLAKDSSVTHVEIAAPWIPNTAIQALTFKYHNVKFAVNCHSNVGFLQADTNGVKLMREYLDTELGALNFNVAGNSMKFVRWVRSAYQAPCVYLPNMYYLDYSVNPNKPVYGGGVLRIGAFGATRPQKNLMSAAGAALELHEELKVDTEFWISGGRRDGGNTIVNSVTAMCQGIPGFALKELNWATWPQFRDNIRKMHLLIQGSYTESFNMVTADGVAEGVPSVVSDAIDWAPNYWKAPSDNPYTDMARVGRQLLFDPGAPYDGMQHLEHHNAHAFHAWVEWLGLVHDIEYISQCRQSSWR